MINIDGWVFSEITSVDGIKVVMDVVELKTNTPTGQYIRKKMPGRMKSGQLTIVRGAIGPPTGTVFKDWMTEVFQGKMKTARKNAVLTILDYGGIPIPGGTFCAKNCWPSTLAVSAFKAGDTNVMTETVTLEHEGLYIGDTPGDW